MRSRGTYNLSLTHFMNSINDRVPVFQFSDATDAGCGRLHIRSFPIPESSQLVVPNMQRLCRPHSPHSIVVLKSFTSDNVVGIYDTLCICRPDICFFRGRDPLISPIHVGMKNKYGCVAGHVLALLF